MSVSKIGRYEIKSELGRGGMATVYLAHDASIGRDVALKLLPREFLHEPTFLERFRREVRIVATLEHPAIVPIYDFGEEGGQPYFVMRYMSGGSLTDKSKNGPMSSEEAARILDRIGSALDHAHKQGIVHRDLKPGNILFDQYGNAFLGDFGIARLTEATSTLTGNFTMGTPAYMSPEQAQGKEGIDGRTDIYALGVILFELLTGQPPFRADTPVGLAMMHVPPPIPPLRDKKPDVPPGVEQVITRAMAKQPNERFTTAAEMVTAFKLGNASAAGPLATTGRAAPVAVEGAASSGAKWKRPLLWLIVGLFFLCLLGSVGTGLAVWFGSQNGSLPLFARATETATITATATAVNTATLPPTETAAPSATATATTAATTTPAPTNTLAPTQTAVPEQTATAEPPTPTLAATWTPTNTPAAQVTRVPPSPTPTSPPTRTPTPLPTPTPIPPPPSTPTPIP
jgi:serine/threonine-protein kinase